MSRMNKLIASLPDEDLRKVKKWINDHPDEVPKDADDAVEMIIHNVSWDYKSRAERAENDQEEAEINRQKKELYAKWKKLGLIE